MSEHGDPTAARNPHAGLTYNTYLRVEELLALQTPRVPERSHDELLFITIHQAYELWFKQILFELDTVAQLLERADLAEARRLVDRVAVIARVLVDQIHILETMTPRDFCHFRSALAPASGFQSSQFRELEYLMGLKDPHYLRAFPLGTSARERLDRRLAEPSLRDRIHNLLRAAGFDLPDDLDTNAEAFERGVRSLLPVYASPEDHRALHDLCEAVVSLDQWIAIWRFHHVRVVERVIGSKPGTGGSPGVRYLDSTTSKRAFPLLWAVRGYLDEHELFAAYRGP